MYPRQKRPFPARSAMLLAMLAATAAFWPPPAVPAERPAAREVRIGLYENAPKIHSDDEGRPAGLFVDLARAMAPPPAQVVPMELRWLLTGAAGLLLILVPASLFLRRKVGQQEKRLRGIEARRRTALRQIKDDIGLSKRDAERHHHLQIAIHRVRTRIDRHHLIVKP